MKLSEMILKILIYIYIQQQLGMGHRFWENDNLYSRYKKYPSKKYVCAKIKIILGLNLNGRSLVPRRKILTEIL